MVEWWRYIVIVILVLLSGTFSGLTLGLLGLDNNNLEILTMGPFEDRQAEKQAKYAKRIIPIRKQGNLLLCTLLLGNVAVNSLLSILMADLTSGTVGFVVSTGVIVIFGQIVPQALCSRHGLCVGAQTVWLVKIFIVLVFIIAKPIAFILDKCLGQEIGSVYTRTQMKAMFKKYEKQNLLKSEE